MSRRIISDSCAVGSRVERRLHQRQRWWAARGRPQPCRELRQIPDGDARAERDGQHRDDALFVLHVLPGLHPPGRLRPALLLLRARHRHVSLPTSGLSCDPSDRTQHHPARHRGPAQVLRHVKQLPRAYCLLVERVLRSCHHGASRDSPRVVRHVRSPLLERLPPPPARARRHRRVRAFGRPHRAVDGPSVVCRPDRARDRRYRLRACVRYDSAVLCPPQDAGAAA